MNPVPAQANIICRTLVARADGSPITAGTVNLYIKVMTGIHAGTWYRDSDDSWQVGETVAAAMAHQGDGQWFVSIDAACWINGVEYRIYAKESGNLHVPNGESIRAELPYTTLLSQINAKLNGTVIRTVNGSIVEVNLTRGETKTIDLEVIGIDVVPTEVRVGIGKQGDPPTLHLELSSSTGAVDFTAYPAITFVLTQEQSDALPTETLLLDVWVKSGGKWYSVDFPYFLNVSERIVGTLS